MSRCLTKGCKSTTIKARSVCGLCYGTMWHMVKTGETTWDALVAAKAILPPHARSRVSSIRRKVARQAAIRDKGAK